MDINSKKLSTRSRFVLIALVLFLPSLFAGGQDLEQVEIPDPANPEGVVIDQSLLAYTSTLKTPEVHGQGERT